MKFSSITCILVACSLVACGQENADPAHPAVTVRISPDGFALDPVTVKRGETVCWMNADVVAHWPASNLHPTHEIYPEFDPKQGIEPGGTWCFAFGRVGIWKYHDHLAPSNVGTVNVED